MEDVPRQAITMGIKSIMQAKKILLIVGGEDKRNPASILVRPGNAECPGIDPAASPEFNSGVLQRVIVIHQLLKGQSPEHKGGKNGETKAAQWLEPADCRREWKKSPRPFPLSLQ